MNLAKAQFEIEHAGACYTATFTRGLIVVHKGAAGEGIVGFSLCVYNTSSKWKPCEDHAGLLVEDYMERVEKMRADDLEIVDGEFQTDPKGEPEADPGKAFAIVSGGMSYKVTFYRNAVEVVEYDGPNKGRCTAFAYDVGQQTPCEDDARLVVERYFTPARETVAEKVEGARFRGNVAQEKSGRAGITISAYGMHTAFGDAPAAARAAVDAAAQEQRDAPVIPPALLKQINSLPYFVGFGTVGAALRVDVSVVEMWCARGFLRAFKNPAHRCLYRDSIPEFLRTHGRHLPVMHSGAEPEAAEKPHELEQLRTVAGFATELCAAVEAQSSDIGGSRGTLDIVRDLARALDVWEESKPREKGA